MAADTRDSQRKAFELTARHMGRYQRQMVLPQVGIEGQRRLLQSRVLVVGAGALGSAAATYLAAAGVGTLGLVDGDRVELSNLHRQILHSEAGVGQLKALSGKERLESLNPDITIQAHTLYLSSENVLDIMSDYDVVVNGSDNFPTRYLVNDAAVFQQKPLVDAAILRFEGQLTVFRPQMGCYRCLFPTPPPAGTVPDCATAGIFGAVAGVMGSMQAVETLKLLLGIGTVPDQHFLIYEALSGTWHRIPFRRDPACLVCGDHPSVTTLIDYESFCGTAAPDASATGVGTAPDRFSVNVEQTHALMGEPLTTIVDVRDFNEFDTGRVPGSQHCPLEHLDQWVAQQPPSTRLVVVCAAGVRSAYAAEYLRSRGFDALTMTGGVSAWLTAGLPWDTSPVGA